MPARPASTPSVDRPDRPLDGSRVVALEQAVAAPYCSSRLADAGARVIRIERREGDFARGYDRAVAAAAMVRGAAAHYSCGHAGDKT